MTIRQCSVQSSAAEETRARMRMQRSNALRKAPIRDNSDCPVASASRRTASAADGTQDAEAFIVGLADQAIAALTPPGISRNEREGRARVLLKDNFAVPTIGQFVLGRYWRTASSEEQKQYLDLFEEADRRHLCRSLQQVLRRAPEGDARGLRQRERRYDRLFGDQPSRRPADPGRMACPQVRGFVQNRRCSCRRGQHGTDATIRIQLRDPQQWRFARGPARRDAPAGSAGNLRLGSALRWRP